MRARITRELIERQGFSFVAIEGDWPDAARVDHYVRHAEFPPSEWTAFARFPVWMWRNEETRAFVDWLRLRNAGLEPERRAAFHGLDLYSLHSSIRSVLGYLDEVDPAQRENRAATLWLPDTMADRSGHLRPRGADRQISQLRRLRRRRVEGPADRRSRPTPSTTASDSSMRRRTRCSWPTPRSTTESCTTARARRGTCATSTCSTR